MTKTMAGIRRAGTGLSVAALMLVLSLLSGPAMAGDSDERLRIVATFSVIGDFVTEVAGDAAELHVLAPVGAEVHEYELRPRDFMALERADVVFANGLDLEQWMPQVEATVQSGVPIVSLAEQSGIDTLPIVTGEYQGTPDPHLWMDPMAAAAYAEQIAAELAELRPDHAETFHANARAYQESLEALQAEMIETLSAIPERERVLITSEAAFLYFGRAFDFHHDGIWGTNAESEGTSSQIMRMLDIIAERGPRAVFWESTISSRYVEGIAADARVDVAGPLYVDSLGDERSGADSYIRMMRLNADTIRNALADD